MSDHQHEINKVLKATSQEFIDFKNWEDMQDRARKAEAMANKTVTDKQREVVYGSYWIKATDSGVIEYGCVIPQQSAEGMQTAESVRALRDMYARGYRYSHAYSSLNPQGEYGDTHLAMLWPITKEEFENALKVGFKPTNADWERNMLLRITKEMRDSLVAPNSVPPASPPPQRLRHQLRLVKLQVATKVHECAECVEPIEKGERYMRVALPGDASVFPDENEVAQEDAWQYVDREWTIEKTHELCYGLRYFKPGMNRD